ncbi:MAG: hypothetical protein FJ242_08270 [Nitrospira sp.]|nr:hypothetical protein [Nitrospira sp.]
MWDYRVIVHEKMFYIHEVYYNDKGDITAISENPMYPCGESLDELKGDMGYFLRAFDRPVLKKEEIRFVPMDRTGNNISCGNTKGAEKTHTRKRR